MKKKYQSYYTNSSHIVEYMMSRLKITAGSKVLEPCAGTGIFIDAILETENTVQIDAYDINPSEIKKLRNKYNDNNQVQIFHADTLLDQDLILKMNMGGYYDFVISNPPYGAWQEYQKRKILKSLYPGLYVKETYGLFLYQSIMLLKSGGRLVFIIPDTYLNLNMHKPLRNNLLKQACIEEIALFPSRFFPGISFGYSKLSIITLHRPIDYEHIHDNNIKIKWGFESVDQLVSQPDTINCMSIKQGDLLNTSDHALLITEKPRYSSIVMDATQRVGDVASCVTGIYSGNDKAYLRVLSQDIRNGSKYEPISLDKVYRGDIPPMDGITEPECFIPIVKGGGVRFIKPDLWFIDWSTKAVTHYKSDKKSRFQNTQFYFNTGIAIPMVSSSNVTATLLEKRIFDQSIVGVFPYDKKYLYYLLGFFNTSICTKLLRIINPTANNSANYIKKLPFIHPSKKELQIINNLVQRIIDYVRSTGGYREEDIKNLNDIYNNIYFRDDVKIM